MGKDIYISITEYHRSKANKAVKQRTMAKCYLTAATFQLPLYISLWLMFSPLTKEEETKHSMVWRLPQRLALMYPRPLVLHQGNNYFYFCFIWRLAEYITIKYDINNKKNHNKSVKKIKMGNSKLAQIFIFFKRVVRNYAQCDIQWF